MNKLISFLVTAMFLWLLPMKSFAQPTRITNNDPILLFDITNIANFDERVFFLYNLTTDGRFDVINSEQDGVFVISGSDAFEGLNLRTAFNEFRAQNDNDFTSMTKEQASEVAAEYKGLLPHEFTSSLMMDYYIRSRQNNTCANADPFCTDNGLYEFPAGVNAGSGESGPYYDCLYTTPNPAWYYMRILNPGNIDIHMYSTPSHDIDFCCWGPFTDPITPCPNGLTANKVVSCSYSTASSEHCMIPSSAQTGDYFILVITNYSNATCNISFSKVAGTGTTDCGILPPLVDNDGPYCVGETIHLTANGQAGATYSWTGPAGFSSNQQNPTRPNCTMNMAGTYTCTIAVGSQTNSAATEVVIYPQPNANFTFTTVCAGQATQFTSTSTTNPSGQQITGFQWNFGDGQSSTQQNPSHQYASAGNYPVTLTVSCGNGHCTSSKTQSVPVHAAPVANAGPDQTIPYNSSAQLSGSGGTGTFNFHWEPANMVTNPNTQNTQTVTLTQDQTYTLTVTNPQGQCVDTDEVTVHIEGSALTVSANANPSSICLGGSTQLTANAGGGMGSSTYSWSPTTALSNPNIYNPIANPTQTTTYTCTVFNAQTNQTATASVTVTVNDVIVEHEYMTICPDDVYHWHGTPCSEANTYQFDTVTDQGCDKTIYLHLDHYPTYDETTVTEAICFGQSYSFYGTTYSAPGFYQIPHTDHTVHGCDSIVTLELTIWPENQVEEVPPIPLCPDQLPYFYEEDPDQTPLYDEGLYIFHPQDEHGCERTVQIEIQLSNYYMPPTKVEYVCELPYVWEIRDVDNSLITTRPVDSAGFYTETVQTAACEGIFRLELNYQPVPETVVVDTVVCDRYHWPTTPNVPYYTVSDTYYHAVPLDPYPCEQVYQLNLTVNYQDVDNRITFDGINGTHLEGLDGFEGISEGDPVPCDSIPFPWLGETLYLKQDTVLLSKTPQGCDYRVKITVKNLQYTPRPEIYCPDLSVPNPHWPITATEFNVNRYTYRVQDSVSDISRWNLGQCEWEISKNSWRIVTDENDPLECMVYAMDWVPDSICLSFKAVNSCSGSVGVVAEYWLHPSFYGVADQEAYPAAVSVIPNPNNGRMQLRFENLEGDLDIRVYSLTGTLVDAFGLKSVKTGETHEYAMKRLTNGVYFLNISDGKRSVTRKVVVIH
jgi:PKD repeat protein